MKGIDITWQEESDYSAGESSLTQWQQFSAYGKYKSHRYTTLNSALSLQIVYLND